MNEPPLTVLGEHPMEQPILTLLGQHTIETSFICCAIITFIIQLIIPSQVAAHQKIRGLFFDIILLIASIVSLLSCVGIVILRFFVVDLVELTFSDWEFWFRRPRGSSAPILYIAMVALPYLMIFVSGLSISTSWYSIKKNIGIFLTRRELKIERSRARSRRPSWWWACEYVREDASLVFKL